MVRDPQMPRVSVETLVKSGRVVPGTAIDVQHGNTVFEYNGNQYIVGPSGQILGWGPGSPRGLLEHI